MGNKDNSVIKGTFTKKTQDKVITATPKKAVEIIEKQVVQLNKNQKAYARKDKQPLKKLDTSVATSYFGANIPLQTYLKYPPNGWEDGTRTGNKIKNVRLQLRGVLSGNATNAIGGYVTFYILHYKRQRTIAAQAFYDAIANTGGIGPFILPDASNKYTHASFRDWEHLSDWQIIKAKKIYLSADDIANQNKTKNFNFSCKLKDATYDMPTTTVLTRGMCQILAICNTGDVATVNPVLGDGWNLTFTYRMTYNDS